MPLLTSPIDGSPMRQIQRFGIELDVCPTSGGIWLDRGELEKLMSMIKEGAEAERRYYPQNDQDDDDDDRYEQQRQPFYKQASGREHDEHYRKGKYKKKGPMNQMMDIFDF